MYDKVSFIIVSVFLLAAAALQARFLLKSYKTPPSPQGFLGVIIMASVLTALFSALLGGEHILIACALALGISMSILNPVCAACFFIAVLFLRPWEALPTSSVLGLLPRGLAALTFFTWLVYALRGHQKRIVWNIPCTLFVVFLAWLFASSFFSHAVSVSLPFFFETFAPITVLFFLILNSFSKREELSLFVSTLAISVLGIVFAAVYITLRDYAYDPRFFRLHSSGLWGNPNDLAALMVCALPLGLGPLLSRSARPSRLKQAGALLYLAVIFAAVLWSQSRGALIAVVLGGITYFLLCMRSVKTAVVTISLLLLVPLLLELVPDRKEQDVETSNIARRNYLIAGLRMAKDYPVFGVGLNNYSELYENYTPAFYEWGKRTAHSSWILVLAESGLFGFLLFVGLCVSVCRHAWRLRNKEPQFFLALITYGTAMSFLSHTYLFLPYIIMAFLIAASRSAARGVACILLLPIIALGPAYAEELKIALSEGAEKPFGQNSPKMDTALKLSGSRAEYLIYLIKASGKGCHKLDSNFEGTQEISTRFYQLPPVQTKEASYPGAPVGRYLDPAIPLNDELCIENGRDSWFLGEIFIPEATGAGEYQGKLTIGEKTLPVGLTVWKMTMPERPALPAYSEMTPWFSVLGHHGKWSPDEAELSQLYTAAMAEHRIYTLKSTIAPLEIRDLKGGGLVLEVKTRPDEKSAFHSVVFENRPAWAYYDFPTVGASGFEKIDYANAARYFEAVENTIRELGRPGRALVYLWDEPKPEMMAELKKLSALVKKKAPSLKQLVTITYQEELADTVDIFCPVMDYFDHPAHPDPEVYRKFKDKDSAHEVWWYVSCMSHGCEALADSGIPDMVIDRPSVYVRSIGWLSKRYGIDSFLYYSVNNGYQYFPKRDPWESLWDFSGNGDGTLFYPGRPGEHGLKKHQPVPSLRLKLWRESSYDAEYINWMQNLKNKPEWWQKEFESLVKSTTEWSKDYSAYRDLRRRAGEYLNGINL